MFESGADLLGVFSIRNFSLLFALAQEAGIESGRFRAGEMGVNRPILLFLKGLDLTLAINNQAQCNGLHAAGGESAAHFIPQQRGNFIAHDAVKHAARLLRVHKISIHLARMIERRANRFRCNFVEGDAKNLFRIGRRNLFLRLGLFFRFGRRLGVLFLPTRRTGFLLHEFRRLREHHRQVSRNRLAFAVRVACQIDRISRVRGFA